MRRALLLLLVACTAPKKPPKIVPVVSSGDDEATRIERLVGELQDEILTSYEREEPPETETALLDARVGAARIGAGPGDFLIGGDLVRAPSRWPLYVDRHTRTEVRSKSLEIHVAADQSAAWSFDDVSWRIGMCGRTAVIPLRITSLYAHDGDRWIPVFEHLSFAHPPAPTADGQLFGKTVPSVVASRDLADTLSSVFSPLLVLPPGKRSVPLAPDAVLLGPDVATEWHGAIAKDAVLTPGTLKAEDRRVGYVGRDEANATVAYWIGNVVADLPARPGVPAGVARMRSTFVFEKRCADSGGCRWELAQADVSQAITDEDLAVAVFGTALVSLNPLQLTCDDGTRIPLPPAGSTTRPPPAAPLP
ncbi:MAG TPA: hypothetical protein VGM88_30695 [Kofleriaceae bacterium]|jgi:hypothetical protein